MEERRVTYLARKPGWGVGGFYSRVDVHPLYKFMERRYAESLAHYGSLRIQTLSYYRGLEESTSRRGDAAEGTKTVVVSYDAPTTLTPKDYPSALRGVPQAAGLKSMTINPGGSLRIPQRHADAFVFCSTSSYDPVVMAGYGAACVQIDDPNRFFAELSSRLAKLTSHGIRFVKDGLLDAVSYGPREEHFTSENPRHACFLKEVAYSDDREIRAFWSAYMRPLTHVDLVCPILPRYCHMV